MNIYALRDQVSIVCYRILGRWAFRQFGRRVRIVWPLRIVGSRWIAVEDEVTLQYGAYVAAISPDGKAQPAMRLGKGTLVGNSVHIICSRRVDIGAHVLIADRVYISDNRHQYEDAHLPVMTQPLMQLPDVCIGDGSWLGENVCVIGCSIGHHCVIGANSVVTRDIPDRCVVVGSPARIVKRYSEAQGKWLRTDSNGELVD
jgi:acetyltransferase-like isoleucine patch superfamily enzyme